MQARENTLLLEKKRVIEGEPLTLNNTLFF